MGRKKVFAVQALARYTQLMKEVNKRNPSYLCPDRTGDAIIQRYRKTRCEEIKFEGPIYSIKSRRPTGDNSDEDIERASLAKYNCKGNLSYLHISKGFFSRFWPRLSV